MRVIHLALLGSLFALAGCASNTVPAGFTNIIGQSWKLERVMHVKARPGDNSDTMLELARQFCDNRSLLMLPGTIDRERIANTQDERLTMTFKCQGDTGYSTPYKGLFLNFSSDDDKKK